MTFPNFLIAGFVDFDFESVTFSDVLIDFDLDDSVTFSDILIAGFVDFDFDDSVTFSEVLIDFDLDDSLTFSDVLIAGFVGTSDFGNFASFEL